MTANPEPSIKIAPALAADVTAALLGLGLSDAEVSSSLHRIGPGLRGLLLYGSRARGDFLPHSDYDLLRLADEPAPTFKTGRLSVSSYTEDQLRSASGTLFGTHLLRDGRVVHDPSGLLSQVVGGLVPADPHALLARVREFAIVLDTTEAERIEYCSGLVRLARYLLRTAIYARAMAEGRPCFSVRELAARFRQPELATILASDSEVTGPPSLDQLSDLVLRLEDAIGPVPTNPYGGLAALAVQEWDENRSLAALAIRAASEDGATIDYTDLPKVLL